MEIIKTENGLPIYSWCPLIEENAMKQMEIVATKLPFVRHVALMPDCHLGQNTCIGSVIACDNVVVPDFCGSDAGCGVAAMRSSLHKSEIENEDVRKKLLHSFSRSIPVGFNHNTQQRANEIQNKYADKISFIIATTQVEKYSDYNPIGNIGKEFPAQVGSLGGG